MVSPCGLCLKKQKFVTLPFFVSIRFTKDSPRFKDELEIMKYICKDFWTAVYKKQIDNLRTNHQVCVAGGTGSF